MTEAANEGAKCQTCGTVVPAGAPKCPGCGRVFGEENRCPHCHAVAGVLKRGPATVCAACGKPRAGAVVVGRAGRTVDEPTRAMLTRAQGRGKRAFGVLALTGGVLMAIAAAMLLPGGLGIAMALLAGLIGVGVGGLALRSGARSMTDADARERRVVEKQVLELAAERGGRLTASDLAKSLEVSVEEADAALTRMVGDGSRVDVDVDDEGVLRYVFRELVPRPRVRVETEDAEQDPFEELEAREAEREAQARRES